MPRQIEAHGCEFNDFSGARGTGIDAFSQSMVVLEACSFDNLRAATVGGAIYIEGAEV